MVHRYLALILQMGKEEHLFPVEEVLPFLAFLCERLHKILCIDIGFHIFLASGLCFDCIMGLVYSMWPSVMILFNYFFP